VPHLRCSGLEFDASQPLRAGLTRDAPTAADEESQRRGRVGCEMREPAFRFLDRGMAQPRKRQQSCRTPQMSEKEFSEM
jgi:hypothetical protein